MTLITSQMWNEKKFDGMSCCCHSDFTIEKGFIHGTTIEHEYPYCNQCGSYCNVTRKNKYTLGKK